MPEARCTTAECATGRPLDSEVTMTAGVFRRKLCTTINRSMTHCVPRNLPLSSGANAEMNVLRLLGVSLLTMILAPAVHADVLDDLARDFWAWRASEMPVSGDDIPRLERPAGWVPDWSPAAAESYRKQVAEFDHRWKAIDASTWPVPRQVDYRLIGSAIGRAHWELEVVRSWQRNPNFYLDQTLGAYFHLLLQPPPFAKDRGANIVATLSAMPKILDSARRNLTEPVRPFAELSLDQLKDIRLRLLASVRELQPLLDADSRKQIDAAAE